ncbi:MAG: histidine kinase, partial [Lachnospiraceae bacterium]|nr:histidine kinase [Lachnospiraceae bacterium]
YQNRYEDSADEPYLLVRMESNFLYRLKNTTSGFSDGGTIFLDDRGASLFATDEVERELLLQKDRYLTEDGTSMEIRISSGKYRMIVSKQLKNGLWIVCYYPISTMLKSVQFITGVFVVMLLVLISIALSILVLYYKNIIRMMNILTNKLHEVELGNLEATIDEDTKNEFRYIFEQFNYMVVRIRLLLQETIKEQKLRNQAEMRQLQLQIQPHFLYNCLSYIVTVANNPSAVTRMAVHLSKYYRYSTRKKSATTIGEEIDYAKSYLEIMAMRKRIEYEIVVADVFNEVRFIPLILQPIIENAIGHAIEEREEATHIKVEIFMKEDGKICFSVSDDGYGLTEEQIRELCARLAKRERDENESVGLWNVNQRLVNYYGKESALTFTKSEWGGLTVSFVIELGKRQDESIDR